MDEREFIDTLRAKLMVAVNDHGPIIDAFHHPDAYRTVSDIINFCINYFLEEANEKAVKKNAGTENRST